MSALALADVRWRARRNPAGGPPLVHAGWLVQPLDARTAAIVAGVAAHVSSLVGRRRREADPDVPATIAGDRRLGRGLASVCFDWYRWRTLSFAEALPTSVAEALARAGIEHPSALRLRLFDFANAEHDGFVPSARRAEALARLALALGLRAEDADALDTALTLDAEDEAILEPAGDGAPPTVAAIAARYNRAVLAALLRTAERITFTLHTLDGGTLRRLYARCRRIGVYCDVDLSPQLAPDEHAESGIRGKGVGETDAPTSFRLTLAGPEAVVGPPAAAGARLAVAALTLLRRLGPYDEGVADLILRERAHRLLLDRTLLRLPGLAAESEDSGGPAPAAGDEYPGATEALSETVDQHASFDSEVEARLAREFAALRRQRRTAGWRLVREPAPLLAGRRVLIPDFALERGGARVFVEVAGFWTPGYLARKRQALEQLPPDTPLVLAVAELSAAALAGLPFPMLTYRDAVPASALLALVEAHYSDFAARTSGATERLASACAAATDGWIGERELAIALGCYTPGELARTLDGVTLPDGWRYLPGAGLCGPALRAALAETLTRTWAEGGPDATLTLADLRARLGDRPLPSTADGLLALLESTPECTVVRGTLFEAVLRPPDMLPPSLPAPHPENPRAAPQPQRATPTRRPRRIAEQRPRLF